jgi:uncharacterized membrane protein (UPF0127 family)
MVNVEVADTYFKKAFGLMFRRPGKYHMEFRFDRPVKSPVHTWFCRMPITITFISEDGQKEVYEKVKPFCMVLPKYEYIKIVETT